MRIIFLDRETLPADANLRTFSFRHTLVSYDRTEPERVAERIASADIVITNKVRMDRAALETADRLRLIAVAATGTDVIDLAACAERNVVVSNIRDYAGHSVPEHVYALILSLRRSVLLYRDAVARGRWQQAKQFCFFDYPIQNLAGSTLGVIGNGALGRATAELGKALGMRPIFAAHRQQADETFLTSCWLKAT
jgi:glycerate dehydrogenase